MFSFRFVPFLALIIGLAGCAFDFESYHEISKLRVLSISVDPPVIAAGEVAQVEILTLDPSSQRELEINWEICLLRGEATESYRCATLQNGNSLGFFLGEGEQLSLSYDELLPQLEDLLRATVRENISTEELSDEMLSYMGFADYCESVPDCDDTFFATLRVEIEGSEREIGLREIGFFLEEPPEDRDLNPEILNIVADIEVNNEISHISLEHETEVSIELGDRNYFDLVALISEETAQQYYNEREETLSQEDLRLSWFSTTGEFSKQIGYFRPDIAPMRELQNTRFEFDDNDFENGTASVRLLSVLRDNRRGQSFWWVDVIAHRTANE